MALAPGTTLMTAVISNVFVWLLNVCLPHYILSSASVGSIIIFAYYRNFQSSSINRCTKILFCNYKPFKIKLGTSICQLSSVFLIVKIAYSTFHITTWKSQASITNTVLPSNCFIQSLKYGNSISPAALPKTISNIFFITCHLQFLSYPLSSIFKTDPKNGYLYYHFFYHHVDAAIIASLGLLQQPANWILCFNPCSYIVYFQHSSQNELVKTHYSFS